MKLLFYIFAIFHLLANSMEVTNGKTDIVLNGPIFNAEGADYTFTALTQSVQIGYICYVHYGLDQTSKN